MLDLLQRPNDIASGEYKGDSKQHASGTLEQEGSGSRMKKMYVAGMLQSATVKKGNNYQ